jgi:hypothetical protein
VHKRKQRKVWGAGESGVARRPETEMVQGCQMVWRKQSAVVGVWGGAGSVAVCDIRPRHRIFLL